MTVSKPFPWKWSVWQNPDQERTNQNARIYLKTILPYNNNLLLTEREGRTGEYWPSVVLYVRSVRTATTSGQYSPVRPSRSVSKRLLLQRANN